MYDNGMNQQIAEILKIVPLPPGDWKIEQGFEADDYVFWVIAPDRRHYRFSTSRYELRQTSFDFDFPAYIARSLAEAVQAYSQRMDDSDALDDLVDESIVV